MCASLPSFSESANASSSSPAHQHSLSERALRRVKMNRKMYGGSRTDHGAQRTIRVHELLRDRPVGKAATPYTRLLGPSLNYLRGLRAGGPGRFSAAAGWTVQLVRARALSKRYTCVDGIEGSGRHCYTSRRRRASLPSHLLSIARKGRNFVLRAQIRGFTGRTTRR